MLKWNNKFKWFILNQRIYLPIVPLWLRYSFKTKSPAFFGACNPNMNMGGFANASKHEVLKHISGAYLPATVFIRHGESMAGVERALADHRLKFPVIVKPDRGERGWKVRKIENMEQLHAYFQSGIRTDILIQEFIDYPMEFCVLYYRYPDQQSGTVSSVGFKEFLSVTGDGKTPFFELINRDKAVSPFVNLEMLADIIGPHGAAEILPEGVLKQIHYVANRGSGVVFRNYNHVINDELVNLFNAISHQVPDFYYGRFDIKVKSVDDLYSGHNLKILELNGVNGMPIHTYDPHFTRERQVDEFIKHWKVIADISMKNHAKGIKYPSLGYTFKEIRHHVSTR